MCKSYFSRKEVELKTDNMLISSFKIAFVFELLQSYECFIYIKNMLCKKKKNNWDGRGGPHYTACGISAP